MLDCSVWGGGSRYFKFENMWLKSEGIVEQVKTWWLSGAELLRAFRFPPPKKKIIKKFLKKKELKFYP
jgi:hypothetical protein